MLIVVGLELQVDLVCATRTTLDDLCFESRPDVMWLGVGSLSKMSVVGVVGLVVFRVCVVDVC